MSQHKENAGAMHAYKKQFGDFRRRLAANCPPAEKLVSFADHDLAGDELQTLKEHVDLCPVCLEALQKLQSVRTTTQDAEGPAPPNWPAVEAEMDARVYSYLDAKAPAKAANKAAEAGAGILSRMMTYLNKFLLPPSPVYAASAFALLLVSIYGYAFFSRPEHFQLAEIQYQTSGAVRTMAGQENDLTRGLQAFELKKYPQAISLLRAYLQTDASHYLANFELGLAYLFTAKKNLLGLSYGFDHERIDQGIHYLKMAQATAVENPYYQEECLWYLAKAQLMAGKAALAKQNLQQLLTLAQPDSDKKQAARDLLLELEK